MDAVNEVIDLVMVGVILVVLVWVGMFVNRQLKKIGK